MRKFIKAPAFWLGYSAALLGAMACSAGVGIVLAWVVSQPAGSLM
ncbi:MAG: hypothetical protein ACRDDI_13470 [Aeromonas veronii]